MTSIRKLVLPTFALLIFVLKVASALAQGTLQNEREVTPERFFLPTTDGPLWGLVDADGRLILKPQYANIYRFVTAKDGSMIGVVKAKDGGFGYIDANGNVLHSAELSNARALTDMGLARFEENGKWGYLNVKGDVIIKPQFKSATPMENGFAVVGDDKRVWYIDANGSQALKGSFASAQRFSKSGFASVQPKKNGKWGVIDRSGKLIIKPKFSFIEQFSDNGLAVAAVGDDYDYTFGAIDLAGDWAIKPSHNTLKSFNEHGLAVFQDRNFNAGVIDEDGQEVYKSRDSNLYVYSDCDALVHGYDRRKFASLDGKLIDNLNKPNYDWFSGFDANCIGLAANNWQWGWLQRNGSFAAFPASIIEPYTTDTDAADIVNINGKFLPAITRNRQLVYTTRDAKIAMTTQVQSDAKSDTLIVSDASGKEHWRASYSKGTLLSEHPLFFRPGNREFGFDERWLSNIELVTEELFNSKAKYFDSFLGEPYDVSGSEIAGAPFGTIKMLARHYVSESNWGGYYFMESSADFSPQFNVVERQLNKSYGRPFSNKDNKWRKIQDLNYSGGDSTTARVWLVDNAYLILDQSIAYGDGDITTTLKLSRLSRQKAKPAVIKPAKAVVGLLETDEESDDDVHSAVLALSQNTSDAQFIQDQANRIFRLINDGGEISEYDYLWTLYTILSAAYPELENGMALGDYIKIADTAMRYLDSNGVGSWVFTEPGQFKMEVYRNAGNGAAWALRDKDPEKALPYIEAALEYARDEDVALNDTYVRVLLNLGQYGKAFAIVEKVLDETPDFGDFQDFLSNKKYQAWLKSN